MSAPITNVLKSQQQHFLRSFGHEQLKKPPEFNLNSGGFLLNLFF